MHGGRFGVFAHEPGLVVGLCYVLGGFLGRGAYVSGTAASDGIDSVGVDQGLAAAGR